MQLIFFILTLCPMTLLNILFLVAFLLNFLRFFIPSAKKEFYFFLSNLLDFSFFSYLIALASNPV